MYVRSCALALNLNYNWFTLALFASDFFFKGEGQIFKFNLKCSMVIEATRCGERILTLEEKDLALSSITLDCNFFKSWSPFCEMEVMGLEGWLSG